MPNSKSPKATSASLQVFVAFDLGKPVGGVWTYNDPRQQTLVAWFKETLSWDIQSFDAWLFSSAFWNSYPRVRQRMIELRVHLSAVLQEPHASPLKRETEIKIYFRTIRSLSMRLSNFPDNLRQSMLAVVDYKVAPPSIKLDTRSVSRIRRLYQERVESGRRYGAQTELARQYGVSLATIRKALQAD